MAKPIKLSKNREFTFAPTAGRGQESKYPWDEWLNGSLLLLERSTGVEGPKGTIEDITEKRDYEVPTGHMPPKLKAAARKRYKVVQISRKDADGNRLGDALIIRARDMDDHERAAEDLLRAEEKEVLKARKQADSTTSPAAYQPPDTQVG